MDYIESIFFEKSPWLRARPARLFAHIVYHSIKKYRNSAIKNQMLMLLAADILSDQSTIWHFFFELIKFLFGHRLQLFEPDFSHLFCESVSIIIDPLPLIAKQIILISSYQCHVFWWNNPMLDLTIVSNLHIFSVCF